MPGTCPRHKRKSTPSNSLHGAALLSSRVPDWRDLSLRALRDRLASVPPEERSDVRAAYEAAMRGRTDSPHESGDTPAQE